MVICFVACFYKVSTIPSSAVTSAWQVALGSQNYNMGVAGLRYTF